MGSSNGSPSSIVLAGQARFRALNELIARHSDEWQQIIGDAREARGLPREPWKGKKLTEVEKLERRLMKLQNQLLEARGREFAAA